ncbi:MAG: HEPN domain-containing protein [Candidatus Methanoperedens sp.]|nr:HEPN domain-containing protein [Candidatus Methanoperedens sp.]
MIALDDYNDALSDFNEGRYPSSVYHAQQCAEKALKALLSFFGVVHEKTHFPSDILGEDILSDPEITSRFQLTKEHIQLMLKMTELASIIEGQRSMPRYGWETKDRIIRPSEIYNEEKADEIIRYTVEIMSLLCQFFETLQTKQMDKLAREIKKCLNK